MTIFSSWDKSPAWEQWIPLWRKLVGGDSLPMIDRWLKTYFKTMPKPVSLEQQLLLSRVTMDAITFAQLICALEHAYQSSISVDWLEWDRQWQWSEIKKIPAMQVAVWLALRCGGDLHSQPTRDKNQRQHFFQKLAALAGNETSSPLGLIWYGLRPDWLPLLEERAKVSGWSQQQLRTFVIQQPTMPPLWLRPQQQATVAQLFTQLTKEDVNVSVSDAGYLVASGGKGINSTQAYKQGFVEIQDLSSQKIAERVQIIPGQKCWDSCAGAGGKTLAIATRTENKGVVVATDLHAYKLEELKKRAKRASLHNIRTFPWDGKAPLRLPKEVAQQQGFDWVLMDAPCTAAGTWRRNPDARWRFSESDSAELIKLQRTILQNAAPAVRKGGHLVYATCSWQVSENEHQVEWFLQQHPEFSLVAQQILGTPDTDADTMFVAVLVRSRT